MSLNIREHQNTLNQTERFYYNNYEYYNQFEDMNEFKTDLSKLRFNIARRSTTTIMLYDTHSRNYDDQSDQSNVKDLTPKYTCHNQFIKNQAKNIQDYFYNFAMAYHQQNYSFVKLERESLPKPFDIAILCFLGRTLLEQFQASEEQEYQILTQIIQKIKQELEKTKGYLQQLYGKQDRLETNELMERWFTFEHYLDFIVESKIRAESKNDKPQNYYLFLYSQYFRWIFNEILSGYMKSTLLMALPQTPSTSLLIHPIILPLCFSLNSLKCTQKILILNLDGKQTYYNIKAVKQLPASVRYISIFKQPEGGQIKSTNLNRPCEQFQVDSNYDNLNFAHSQLIFRQARPRDLQGALTPPNQNIILYPLNSLYLRRAYAASQQGKSISERTLPVLGSSDDIKWLWDERISAQVEQWSPQLIFVSYNGFLDLKEDHFNSIMKDLTIFSDHKLVLIPNMSGLLKKNDQLVIDEQSGEWSPSKIQMAEQFFERYAQYKYDKVDEERYFNNLSSFIKISSGNYSLKTQIKNNPTSKYELGRRLNYLKRLSKIDEYSDMIIPPYQQSEQIQQLFKEFGLKQLKQNKKENEYWERIMDQIEQELGQRSSNLNQNFRQEFQVQGQTPSDMEVSYRILDIKQELEIQFARIYGEEVDIETHFSEMLKSKKEKILLENLEHYRYRKIYMSQEEDRGGRIRNLRFCIGEEEEITLERYSQVIADEKRNRYFIINYREGQQKHVILQGEFTDRGPVTVQKVNTRIEESLGELNLENKSQILRINYSHCFVKEKLYLFWPQEWDIRQEIRRKLLGLEYHPPHVNYMLRLQYQAQERGYLIDHLKPKQATSLSIERRGCVGVEAGENKFYIFGGIYDSRLDYYNIQTQSQVNLATIQEYTFNIVPMPKKSDKNSTSNILKPKMNYRVEKNARGEEGASVTLSGGYGRAYTNFHSLISFENFSLTFEPEAVKITQNVLSKYRLTKLEKPISLATVGRYLIGPHGEAEERFSENVKDWVIAESRNEKNSEREILCVIQDQIRANDFKTNYKRHYLFGWDRTIRQRIYIPHCWSPQLQIVTGQRLHFVYTSFRTQKSGNYNIGNLLIPKQQDIVSMCIEQDRLLLLANSPIINTLDNKPNNYILYEGSLANINDLLTRKELVLHDRFQFKNITDSAALHFKGIFSLDQKVYLIGGISKTSQNGMSCRQDYILESAKDKLKMKIKKLQCSSSSLDLVNPIVVKYNEKFLIYALASQQRKLSKGTENQVVIEDFWKIKIQTFSTNEATSQEVLYSQPLQIYHYDFEKREVVPRKTSLDQPKLIKVIKYIRFSQSLLREYLQKIYIKVNKYQDEKYEKCLAFISGILTQSDEKKLQEILRMHHHRGNTFKQLLMQFDFLLDEEKKERENKQNQQLVQDLRALFSLLNKHLLQTILLPEPSDCQLYRFILEDRASRKVKYVAIGPLLSPKLKFLRIRYKHELSICLNEKKEEELFYNTSVLACEQITKQRVKGGTFEVEQPSQSHKVTITYRN